MLAVLLGACGDSADDSSGDPRPDGGPLGPDGGGDEPSVPATDPCEQAGFFFDGSSDCDEVRCPELHCDCPIESSTDAAPTTTEVTLEACVAARGCLARADCARICDPARSLTKGACEARIAASGALACEADADCVRGECRTESVGALCIAGLGCGEDGHCGAGERCVFDPNNVDETTGFPLSLGRCSDGAGNSPCHADDDCDFGHCEGQLCNSGEDGDTCNFNSHCASDFCRTTDPSSGSGFCVSGQAGGGCSDASDCADGLHCTGGTCFTGADGQICDTGDQCDSGVCYGSRCQSRKSGAYCNADDSECDDGFCVGSVCSSGTLWSPCTDGGDCKSGLSCPRGVCSDGSRGLPCVVDEDCSVLACVDGACSDGSNGSRCDMDAHCTSNRCADPAGADRGECTDGQTGSYCQYPANCISNTCGVGNVCD